MFRSLKCSPPEYAHPKVSTFALALLAGPRVFCRFVCAHATSRPTATSAGAARRGGARGL